MAPAARCAASRSARRLRAREEPLLAPQLAELLRLARNPGRGARPPLALDQLVQRRAGRVRVAVGALQVAPPRLPLALHRLVGRHHRRDLAGAGASPQAVPPLP